MSLFKCLFFLINIQRDMVWIFDYFFWRSVWNLATCKKNSNNSLFEQFEISEPCEIPPEGFAFQGNNLINVNWFKSVSWLMKWLEANVFELSCKFLLGKLTFSTSADWKSIKKRIWNFWYSSVTEKKSWTVWL